MFKVNNYGKLSWTSNLYGKVLMDNITSKVHMTATGVSTRVIGNDKYFIFTNKKSIQEISCIFAHPFSNERIQDSSSEFKNINFANINSSKAIQSYNNKTFVICNTGNSKYDDIVWWNHVDEEVFDWTRHFLNKSICKCNNITVTVRNTSTIERFTFILLNYLNKLPQYNNKLTNLKIKGISFSKLDNYMYIGITKLYTATCNMYPIMVLRIKYNSSNGFSLDENNIHIVINTQGKQLLIENNIDETDTDLRVQDVCFDDDNKCLLILLSQKCTNISLGLGYVYKLDYLTYLKICNRKGSFINDYYNIDTPLQFNSKPSAMSKTFNKNQYIITYDNNKKITEQIDGFDYCIFDLVSE